MIDQETERHTEHMRILHNLLNDLDAIIKEEKLEKEEKKEQAKSWAVVSDQQTYMEPGQE